MKIWQWDDTERKGEQLDKPRCADDEGAYEWFCRMMADQVYVELDTGLVGIGGYVKIVNWQHVFIELDGADEVAVIPIADIFSYADGEEENEALVGNRPAENFADCLI